MALLSSQTVYVKRGANVVQETLYKTNKRIFVDGYLRYAPDDMIPEDEALKYGVITQEELDARKSGGEEVTQEQEQPEESTVVMGNNAADFTTDSVHFTSEELGEQPSPRPLADPVTGRDPEGGPVRERGVDQVREPLGESGSNVPDDQKQKPDESSDESPTEEFEDANDKPPAPSIGAKREEWDKHAQEVHGIDTSEMTNKQQVIDAVYEAEQRRE